MIFVIFLFSLFDFISMLLGWKFHCFAPNWDLLLFTCIDITLATSPNCREGRNVHSPSESFCTQLWCSGNQHHHVFIGQEKITSSPPKTVTCHRGNSHHLHHNHQHNHHHITIITTITITSQSSPPSPLRTATSCWTSARSWCRPWWRGSAELTLTSG